MTASFTEHWRVTIESDLALGAFDGIDGDVHEAFLRCEKNWGRRNKKRYNKNLVGLTESVGKEFVNWEERKNKTNRVQVGWGRDKKKAFGKPLNAEKSNTVEFLLSATSI